MVAGATHTSFSDWPLLAIRSWSPARRALGGVAGPGVHDAMTAAIRPFLDRHLRAGTADVDAALRAVAGLRVDDPGCPVRTGARPGRLIPFPNTTTERTRP